MTFLFFLFVFFSDSTRWTSWPLIVGFVFNAVLLLSSKPVVNRSLVVRFIHALVSGTCAGLYIGGSFIPFASTHPSLFVSYSLAGFLFFFNLFFVLYPMQQSGKILRVTVVLFVLWQQAIILMQDRFFDHIPGGRGKALALDARTVVNNVGLICHLLLAILINQLITQTARVSTSSSSSASSSSSLQPRPPVKGKRILSAIHNPARDPTDLALGTAGNVSTLCAVLAVKLAYEALSPGNHYLPFVIAPLFLFLNPGTLIKFRLTSRTRYFPMVAVLFGSSFLLSVLDFADLYRSSGSVFLLGKNLLLLMIPAPSLFFFALYMATLSAQDGFLWSNLTPINLAPLALSDLFSVQITAVLAIAAAVTRYLIAERIRKASLQHI